MNRLTPSSPLPPRDRPPFDQADSATGAGSAASHPSSTAKVVPILPHRMAQAMRDGEMLEEIERRLRKGSPKSGARHVRLTDSRMVGPNEFEELGSPFHWTTWACVIVAVCIALIFVGQLARDHLARLFS